MLDENVLSILNDIAEAIKEAGLNPYDQLYGYMVTGGDRYITRNRKARERIKEVSFEDIQIYLYECKK